MELTDGDRWPTITDYLVELYVAEGHSPTEARDKAGRAVQRMIEEKERERELLQRD